MIDMFNTNAFVSVCVCSFCVRSVRLLLDGRFAHYVRLCVCVNILQSNNNKTTHTHIHQFSRIHIQTVQLP